MSSGSENEYEEDPIEKELDELEDLQRQIEEKENEIALTEQHNIEMNQEIQQLQSKISSAKIVNKTVSLNKTRKNVSDVEIDESQFNSEHRDLLNELHNKINDLRQQTEKSVQFNQELEKEVLNLIAENAETERDVENYKMQLKRVKHDQAAIESDIQMKQSRLKSINDEIMSTNRAIKVANNTVAELTERKESLHTVTNSNETLDKEILSLTRQSYDCQARIDNLNASIEDAKDQIEEIKTARIKETKRIRSIIGWEDEIQSLTDEKAKLKEKLDEMKKVTAKSDSQLQMTQKRYNGIRILAKKWKNADLSEYEEKVTDEEDIDSLLSKAFSVQRDVEKGKSDVESELLVKRQQIEKLEGKVISLREEIDRKLTIIRKDEQQRKSSIESQRKKMFDSEEELIAKIQELKIKIAQKKLNK